MTKVNVIKCPVCGDSVFSRATHDFRHCSCGGCFADGGFDYFRCGGREYENSTTDIVEVDATKQELYDDWNHYHNKFGLIKQEKINESN